MKADIKTAETILDFLHVRPVQKATQTLRRFAAYSATTKSPLHQRIAALPVNPAARDGAIALASAYMTSANYLATPPPALVEAAKKLAIDPRNAIANAVPILGRTLAAWLADPQIQNVKTQLWDSLYAQVLLPSARPVDRDGIYLGIRCFHFLETVMANPDLWPAFSWPRIQKIRPLLPPDLVPSAPTEIDPHILQQTNDATGSLQAVLPKVRTLLATAGDLRINDQIYHENKLPIQPVVSIYGAAAAPPMGAGAAPAGGAPAGVAPAGVAPAGVAPAGAAPAGAVPAGVAPAGAVPTDGSVGGVVTISLPEEKPWTYDAAGNPSTKLKADTQTLLAARKNEFENKMAIQIALILEQEAYQQADKFLKSVPASVLGLIARKDEFRDLVTLVPLASAPLVDIPSNPAPGSPEARGIRPLGMGDLLMVKQILWKYEAGEVAHVENVLASEFKTRTHVRTQETEETIITETERIEESEKDTQSTERFELQREVQETVESYTKMDAGLAVSGSYGFVSFSAHADFALGQSSSESNKTASNFAKEVTERSVSKLSQRTREERIRRTLQKIEEKNEHGFDNKAGASNITGVYRWVDKYYKARVINRGKRLMMEFVIPEPAAFYLYALKNPIQDPHRAPKPQPPSFRTLPLKPDHLLPCNYMEYVATYLAQGVEPFPDQFVQVGTAITSQGGKENAAIATTDKSLVIPSGYTAISHVGGGVSIVGQLPRFWMDVQVAGVPVGMLRPYGLQGTVTISAVGWAIGFQANLVLVCALNQKGISAWQLKTFQAIMDGYARQLAEWTEQTAAREIQTGVQIEGRNPEFNRKIERDELRKASLRLLTNEYARTKVGGSWRTNEEFNSMSAGSDGYPELDPAEALVEGKIIQFFEQAFEWNNITYRFLPYFWGKRSNWIKNYTLSDPDPAFTDFLRAGASRVVVPVHPEYTEAVLHYLHTNEVWNGGEPPTLDDPLYVSIVDEIKSDNDADLADAPVCSLDDPQYPCIMEEFDIKLPTTLVWLQQNADLPRFDIDALPNPPAPPATPAAITAGFDARAAALGDNLNWRRSVVDLAKVLGIPSALQYRRALAKKLGCPPNTLNAGSAEMNTWLHARLLVIAFANNGEIPADIRSDD